jgi:hypothetical protein
MQTYIGDIVTNARLDTQNQDDIPTSTNQVGIETKDFLRYANYAQQRLQGRISKVYPYAFEATIEIAMVADQASYSIADHVYLGTRIRKVEYSPTSAAKDYYPLPPTNPYNTYNGAGMPCAYHRRDGNIIVEPIPSTAQGSIRVTYERTLDKLALRRGRINGTPSGAVIDLTHSTFGAPSTSDEALFVAGTYICVSDHYGTPLLYNGIISSYNAGTDDLTLAANVSTYLPTGGTLAGLADGYITLGKYTTTHSKLPEDAERYLTEYANRRVFKRELSSATGGIDADLVDIENELVSSYKVADKDVKPIPISDYSYFDIGF